MKLKIDVTSFDTSFMDVSRGLKVKIIPDQQYFNSFFFLKSFYFKL